MRREDFEFEVCANGVESCLAAQEGGADRVELCAGIPEGGTTPSYGEIKTARRLLTTTRLHVIIRPRGGDFLYSPLELERMEEDIRMCKELGVDGVVFGCLTEQGDVDMEANRRLLALARPMSVTFHRAFDLANSPREALTHIITLGFDRLLTSGMCEKAVDGTAMLATLEQDARGRIILMAGSGVCEDNIRQLYEATGIHAYHFSLRERVESRMSTSSGLALSDSLDVSHMLVTSAERVRRAIALLPG